MRQQHGMTGNTIYYTWKNIKSRCYNPTNPVYKHYGARGITICDEWENDFTAFFEHVITLPNYGLPGYSLDREDNDKGYYPGNIRWVTKSVQQINKGIQSNNRSGYIGVFGVRHRWRSYITVEGTRASLGTFNTIEEAVEARNQYIIENKLTEYKIQTYG